MQQYGQVGIMQQPAIIEQPIMGMQQGPILQNAGFGMNNNVQVDGLSKFNVPGV